MSKSNPTIDNTPSVEAAKGDSTQDTETAKTPFFDNIFKIFDMISTSTSKKDSRLTIRALRQTPQLKLHYTPELHLIVLTTLFPNQSSSITFHPSTTHVNGVQSTKFKDNTHAFMLDVIQYLEQKGLHKPELDEQLQNAVTTFKGLMAEASFSHCMPELAVFNCILILSFFMKQKAYTEAVELSTQLVTYITKYNRRSLDMLSAKAFFYYSWAYETTEHLSDIRLFLLTAYRKACLHQDIYSQATLLNLILRNYLHYNYYDLAFKFINKTSYVENLSSNAQHARYLFYLGKIFAVQLEYSESYNKLIQALRKAPQTPGSALGFKSAVTKMAIIVELLMGDIPDRSTFNQKDLRETLQPYMNIVMAVRSGDLQAFSNVMKNFEWQFEKDKTLFLIKRLHHSVIRAGLRMINLSYSKITMVDIANRLGLEMSADIESIISKAILDGVIDAEIHHENQVVEFKSQTDIYSTDEPLKTFHRRISFCLQLHADAIKAMRYPEEREKSIKAQADLLNELKAKKVLNDDIDAI